MDQTVSDKITAHFAKYPEREYKKGQILVLAGEKVPYVYHLVSGTVKQYAISYRGDEVIVNMFKPPAFFPMSHAMHGNPSQFVLEAETDITVHLASVDETVAFLKDNPDVLYDLLSRVYRGLDGLLGRVAHLMTSNAKGRVIYELLIEAKRFGAQHKNGTYTVRLSEKDLGARAGLSRETINRELQKLKTDELIELSRNVVRIPDLEKLETALQKASSY